MPLPTPPMPDDTPEVAALKRAGVPLCGETLAVGMSCLAVVRAEQLLSRTPLAVKPGEVYRITVPAGQVWQDASRRNTPPHGEDGSWVMNLFKRWKRQPRSQWFALIATTVAPDPQDPREWNAQDISTDGLLRIAAPGVLAFYPNDAVMPWRPGWFYANNSGQIWVLVARCADQSS